MKKVYSVKVKQRKPSKWTGKDEWHYLLTAPLIGDPRTARELERRLCKAFPEVCYDVAVYVKETGEHRLEDEKE